MSSSDRLAQLNALHLYGMATAWGELLAEGPRRPAQPEAWLDRLIEAEIADRQVRSLRYQLNTTVAYYGVDCNARQSPSIDVFVASLTKP